MYNKVTVTKPAGISAGSASAKDPNVTIFDFNDVLYFPPRDSKGIVMAADIVMKPNTSMIQVYMTKSKISAPYTSDGDEDSISIKNGFEGQHPGNRTEIKEFIQNWLGKDVGIIFGSCSETEKEVIGTPCAPLQLKPEKKDDNDGRFHMLKFEAFAKSNLLPATYTGALTLAAPTAVASPTGVDIDTAASSQYKLAANAAGDPITFDALAGADRGTFTLIGSGGADPAERAAGVAGTATVILTAGATWVALDGAFITFEYVNGGGTKYLVEKARG